MRSTARIGCRVVVCLLAAASLFVSTTRAASASGFFLLEQSARLQGTSYAGTAALAEDASTVYYNPAGMSRIKDWSFMQSGYLVSIHSELENASATNFGQPVTGPTGKNSASAGLPCDWRMSSNRLNIRRAPRGGGEETRGNRPTRRVGRSSDRAEASTRRCGRAYCAR